MKENFSKAFAFAMRWEGGYCNDKDDPGGETKFGICKRDFPHLDIKSLTAEQAGEIYRDKYWTPAGCDELLYPLDLIVFDAALNCGAKQSRGWYDELKEKSPDLLLARRILYYMRVIKKQPKLKRFMKGWFNRVADLATTVL